MQSHQPHTMNEFGCAERSTYLRVDVDAIWHNICILKSKCAQDTEVISVIKANAYGHGSVGVAKYLTKCGQHHFAVATASEGKELRDSGIEGFIQIFGNSVKEEIDTMMEHCLTPTATSLAFIKQWAGRAADKQVPNAGTKPHLKPAVVIKVDTGMSRNGCQLDELPVLVNECERQQIPVHSIMTHFAQSWDDPDFTKEQLDKFLEATDVYRKKGVKIHATNSAGIVQGFGTDLDFVRPGIMIYGLAPDSTSETATVMQAMGFKPALSWIARPSLVKNLESGRKVGYDQTYAVKQPERIATFSLGYADGYNRLLSGKGIITDFSGKPYEVVGRVSMDAITVRVDDSVTEETPFYIIKNDYTSANSASNMAAVLKTIPYEIGTSLASRLPRIHVTA